jgi:plasmid stabilization system protein ParE
MANIRLLRKAVADLDEAIAWYESRDLRAAERFRQEVNAALDRISALPESYPLSDWQHRLCLIRKSQYIVVYRYDPDENEVIVVGFPHGKRDPKKWPSGS